MLGLGDHGAEPLLEQGLVVEGLLHQLPQAVQLMGLDFPVAGAGLEVRVAVTFGADLVVDQVIGKGGDKPWRPGAGNPPRSSGEGSMA